MIDFNEIISPKLPKKMDFKIGCIGSGFIMSKCHLVAYRNVAFNPVAIASRNVENAKRTALKHNIPKIHDTWKELVDDSDIEILDIAIPPDQQPEVVEYAVTKKHIKGILCQKPLAMNIDDAKHIVELCEEANVKIGINSNMRYDQSIRVLKAILDENLLGERVIASIEMRATLDWQNFLKKYDRLEILNMGIHHIDSFRYLFGNPKSITCVARKDPRFKYNHIDGISQYTFQYEDGFIATSLDDVYAWAGEGTEKDSFIKWRVEGTKGMAKGTIGWPGYPEKTPSTIQFTTKDYPNRWISSNWDKVWFPDAYEGTMAQLLCAVEQKSEPEISAKDHVDTIACVEACYKSIDQKRTVYLKEILI